MGQSDVELLRLAGWCKNLPVKLYGSYQAGMFQEHSIEILKYLGLLHVTSNGGSLRLTAKGWRLLRHMGYDYHRDKAYCSDFDRRVEISHILLAFYRAGYHVFAYSPRELDKPAFAPSIVARREGTVGGAAWGGGSFWGFARLREHCATCYYLPGHAAEPIPYHFERQALGKISVQLGIGEAMVFAGKSYIQLARILSVIPPKPKGEKRTFAQILHGASYPIHLLECSDAGALQLLIMSIENYRTRPGPVLFDSTAPPPLGVKDADGSVSSGGVTIPWVSALDMDLWRIGRACRQAAAAGLSRIAMVCLEKQAAALERMFAGDSIKITLVPMSKKQLLEAFGLLRLYEPEQGVWIGREGGMLDAAHLPVD